MPADNLPPIDETEMRRIARKRVGMKRGFQIHLLVFVTVNAGLLLVNLQTSPNVPWAQWPAMGWGLGLAIHGLLTWLLLPRVGRQNDAIEREMATLRQQSRN